MGPYIMLDAFDVYYSFDMTFSSDGKSFAYIPPIDGIRKNLVLIDGIPYTGGICAGRAVYLKDGAIWAR